MPDLHSRRTWVGVLVLVALLLVPNAAAVDVSACTNLNAAGTYQLTGALAINGFTCLNVTASNVRLDLNGFTITGNKTTNTNGVNATNVINFTLLNGTIRGFSEAIELTNVTNFTIRNVTTFNSTVGLEAERSAHGNVSYSNVSYSDTDGVAFDSSWNVTFQSNTVQDNVLLQTASSGGFDLDNVTNFTFLNNAFYRNFVGLSLNQSSAGNLFWYDSVFNSSNRSMLFDLLGANNRLVGVNISGNTSNVNYSDFEIRGNSALALHDVSFNKSSITFQNASSNLTVSWTVYVNVSNAAGPLSGFTANLTASGSSTANFSQSTNASGFTVQNVTEYFQNGSQVYGTNQTSYSPYRLAVNSSDHSASYFDSHAVTSAATLSVAFPVLTGLTTSSIGHSSATVSWTSSLSANASVQYGPTQSYGSRATQAASSTAPSIDLSGLSPAATYFYQVTSCTSQNACNSSTNSFLSGPLPVLGGTAPTPQATKAPETSANATVTPTPVPTPICPPVAVPDCINAQLVYPNRTSNGCPVAPICVPVATITPTPTVRPTPTALPTPTATIPPGVTITPTPAPRCSDVYDPVCAIDNRTYANACLARQAGFNVSHSGPCTPVATPIPRDCAVSFLGADLLCQTLDPAAPDFVHPPDCFVKVGGVGMFCKGVALPDEQKDAPKECVLELFGAKFFCNYDPQAEATPTPEVSPSLSPSPSPSPSPTPSPTPMPQSIETFGEGYPAAALVVYQTQHLSPHEQKFVDDMRSVYPRVDVVAYSDVSVETAADYVRLFVIEHEPELLKPQTIEALYTGGQEIVLLGPAADYKSELLVEGKKYE